jgi:hypothetical protein
MHLQLYLVLAPQRPNVDTNQSAWSTNEALSLKAEGRGMGRKDWGWYINFRMKT